MDVQRALPRSELRSVVRAFQERRADLGGATLAFPVAARPHQILDIHLGESYRVAINGGAASVTPEAFIVGPKLIGAPTSTCLASSTSSTFCSSRQV